jgi:hypothetical protein
MPKSSSFNENWAYLKKVARCLAIYRLRNNRKADQAFGDCILGGVVRTGSGLEAQSVRSEKAFGREKMAWF